MRTQGAMETLNIATGRVGLLKEITELGESLTEYGNISAFDLAYGLGKIRDKVLTEEESALANIKGDVTITITADEASTIKRLLIREEHAVEKLFRGTDDGKEEEAELTALRQKIHTQI